MRPPVHFVHIAEKLFQLARLFVWQMLTHTREEKNDEYDEEAHTELYCWFRIANLCICSFVAYISLFLLSVCIFWLCFSFWSTSPFTDVFYGWMWIVHFREHIDCIFERIFFFRSFIPVLIRPLRSDDFVQNSTNHSTKTWQYFFLFVVCHIEQHNYGISPHFQAMHVSIEQTYCTFCHLAIKTKHAKRERAKCSLWWFYAVPYK